MNQVVPFHPQAQVPAPSFTMSDMERVALAIAKGGLFGSSDPNAVLTLCMLAQAEGQHPAVVFRDYHIISGKPAKKAEAMQRDFLAAGGKIEWHKLDDDECSATFSHPQGGSATISWDKKRVEQAELGGNKMHKKYPRQMLRSRVISEGVRTVFPMATSGLYETGEVQDMVPEQSTPATPQPKRARDLKPEPIEVKPEPQPTADIGLDAVLATLKNIAKPGNMDALGAAWKEIGADARKALASELPALKAACTVADVAFDAETGEIADEHPAEATVAAYLGRAKAAETTKQLVKIIAEAEPHKEALGNELAMKLELGFDQERNRIEASEGVSA